MKRLYESLLDDEDDVLDSISDDMISDWFEMNTTGKYKYKIYKTGKHRGSLKITGDLIIKGFTEEKFPEFLNIDEINGSLIIEKCPNLININNLFTEVGICKKNFTINNCPKLISLKGGPYIIYKTFTCVGNKSLKSLEGCPTMAEDIYLMKNGKKFNMKYISDHINQAMHVYCNSLEDDMDELISEGLINEALNEPHLLRLAEQLKKYNIKNVNNHLINFKSIFASNSAEFIFTLNRSLRWDEVDSTNIIELSSFDKAARKMIKQMTKRKLYALVLIQDSSGEYIAATDGKYYQELPCKLNLDMYKTDFEDNEYDSYNHFGVQKRKPDEIERLTDIGKCIFILNWDHLSSLTKQNERRLSREGMVLQGDPTYYNKVASNNIDRYKKIIAQNKLQKNNKIYIDLSNRVYNTLERWHKLTLHILQHPEVLALNEYDFHKILDYLGDSLKSYSYSKSKYLEPGLLKLFGKICSKYATSQNDKDRIYNYTMNEMQNDVKKINDILDEIDTHLKKFNF